MIALATFLARLIPWLGSYFLFAFQAWHLAAFAGVVGLVVLFLDKILLLLAWFGGLIIEVVVVHLVIPILLYLIGALPGVPTEMPNVAWATLLTSMQTANRYLPLDLAMQYFGILATVYGAILTWKLVKFIRGGG